MKENKNRVIIANDLNERDEIGVEIYKNNELIAEIFRDDTDKTRTIRVFEENSPNFLYGFSIRFFLGDVFFLGEKLLNI